MKLEKTKDGVTIFLPDRCEGKLSKELYELLLVEKKEPIEKLIFDFSATSFIDSSFIGILVTIDRDLKSNNATLSLRKLNSDILELFIDTGLDMLFTIQSEHGVTEARMDLFEESVDIKLEIESEAKNDVSIFHLSGVMNHPIGSRYFKQKFLLTMADFKKIILDFENLTFFDSLSVSVVLSMHKLLKETGGGLRFCNANYIVNDLFTTLNINQIIPIYDTIEGALAEW